MGFQYDLFSTQAVQQKLSPSVWDKLKTGEKVVLQEETQGAVKSRLLSPLMLYDQMIGVLGFEDDDPKHEWSTDEIMIIEAVSNQVILALDNASLLDETQLRTDQLRLLQDITSAAASHTRLSELLEDVSQKLRAGLDVERCMIALMNPDGIVAHRKAIASAHPLHQEALAAANKILVMENDLIQQALTRRKSVVRYKEEGLPLAATGMDLPSQPAIHAKVVIPLSTRETVVGLIELDVADPARQFGEDDLQLFDQLSLQISSAIEVTRSIEQTSIRAEQERMISEITARMRATLDVESVMRTAVDEIFQTGDYADVSIYLATDEGTEH